MLTLRVMNFCSFCNKQKLVQRRNLNFSFWINYIHAQTAGTHRFSRKSGKNLLFTLWFEFILVTAPQAAFYSAIERFSCQEVRKETQQEEALIYTRLETWSSLNMETKLKQRKQMLELIWFNESCRLLIIGRKEKYRRGKDTQMRAG